MIDLERGCCERMEKEEDEKGKRKGAAASQAATESFRQHFIREIRLIKEVSQAGTRGQNEFGCILFGK